MPVRAFVSSRAVIAFASSAAALGLSPDAGALIVQGGSMPRPDLAFIGEWNGSSAVAVGPRTIITAAHVGGGAGMSFVMDGRAYASIDAVTHPAADLMVVHLGEDLPGWHDLAPAGAAARGGEAILGGMGRVAAEAVPGGLAWSAARAESWGRNIIDRAADGLLAFDFDDGRAALEHEAAFALHDSGGGVFLRGDDGALRLAGLAVSIDGALGTSRFGGHSFALDLSAYAGFIGGTVPAPGAIGLFGLATMAAARRRRK